ncbi:MAG: N-acetylmuramoyl-L-alanine amidase [Clostridiaceae bacterium]|nr:N-acetylmuramoyl-L-alanine amidase [Clostridiaceae bacterium]
MRKHSPIRSKTSYRRQGVVILTLIIAIICCAVAIGVFVAADLFSKRGISIAIESSSDISSGSLTTPQTESVVTLDPTPSESSDVTESTKTSETEPTDTTERVPPTIPTGITGPDLTGYVVVLDPGHQLKPNREQEPLSPTMSGSKDKVSAGTQGVTTGRPEYEVNLEIGVLLRDYLESLGCTVYMTRTENDVNISNIERAQFALSYTPDAYIRLHCDGSSDPNRKGIGVFIADSGKHKDKLPGWSDLLGNALSEATGAKYRGYNASSRYSGLNWATDIPSFLLEMGFMTNPEEDILLSHPEYQLRICEGIANFVSQMPLNPDRPTNLD